MLTTCGRNWIAQQQRHQLQRPRHWLIRYIMTELNAYTSEPTINRSQCPLGWWLANKNKYPVVAAVARQMLSVLATSVASERFFFNFDGVESQAANSIMRGHKTPSAVSYHS